MTPYYLSNNNNNVITIVIQIWGFSISQWQAQKVEWKRPKKTKDLVMMTDHFGGKLNLMTNFDLDNGNVDFSIPNNPNVILNICFCSDF